MPRNDDLAQVVDLVINVINELKEKSYKTEKFLFGRRTCLLKANFKNVLQPIYLILIIYRRKT